MKMKDGFVDGLLSSLVEVGAEVHWVQVQAKQT